MSILDELIDMPNVLKSMILDHVYRDIHYQKMYEINKEYTEASLVPYGFFNWCTPSDRSSIYTVRNAYTYKYTCDAAKWYHEYTPWITYIQDN